MNKIKKWIIPIIIFSLFGPKIVQIFFFIGAWMVENKLPPLSSKFSLSEILQYYGLTLAFLGTTFLGIVTLVQNTDLQKRNLQLEEQNYIANNALVLIQSNHIYKTNWRMHKEYQKKVEWLGNVIILTNDDYIKPDSSQPNFRLDGEIVLDTIENKTLEYKIENLGLNFDDPNISKTYSFSSSDEFKPAQPITSTSHKLQMYLNFGVSEWEEKFKKQLLNNDFKLTLMPTIEVLSNNVVSKYFLFIKIEPIEELIHDSTAHFLPKHTMVCQGIIKSKDPYKL